MSAIELTVPCVAAHLLAEGVLRFLPTDATAECETCEGKGRIERPWGDVYPCPACIRTGTERTGRRSLRAGDRIAIRADNDVPGHCEELGRWMVTHKGDGTIVMYDTRAGRNYYGAITLHPGEVVGYATVARVLPIVDDILYGGPCVCGGRTSWLHTPNGAFHLSDHVAAGLVFTPGQIALELATGNDQ